jgi:molybdate transport system ATP-binding protein
MKGKVAMVKPGSGPGALVQLAIGSDSLLARITKRSVDSLQIRPGVTCYAVIKTVSIAPMEIGSVRADGGQGNED